METFTCNLLEQRENSLKVSAYGKVVFLPRSQIEKLQIDNDRCVVTIPYWLFKEKFE